MPSAQAAIDFAKARPNTYLAELFDFLKIPSISTRAEHDDDVCRAANWLKENLETAGLNNARLFPTLGHPLVYADWLEAGPDKPTILFYGHYDVQPADNVDLWRSPPFEPRIHNNSVYARGAADDKGQVMIIVKAVEAFLRTSGKLPVNVKFLIEGEEESGGKGIEAFLPEHRERLAADVALVCDTAMADFNKPAIVYGLRGIVSITLTAKAAKLDLHSGVYGGSINNPINMLARLISKMQDDDGHVLIPGFYDDVRVITEEEHVILAASSVDETTRLRRVGAYSSWGEPAFTPMERTGARPSLDVNGFVGGYTGDGGKTIIPSQAHAKISMRMVPDQDPQRILELILAFVRENGHPSIQMETEIIGTSPASLSDIKLPAMQSAAKACETVFGQAPVYMRSGGSIPIVGQFQRDLGLETILLGFSLPHDRIHAPNERFHLPNFYNGIETVIRFLANYGENNG